MLKGVLSIYKKELQGYFYSSIAYVFMVIFIVVPNLLFFFIFGGIFKENNASMRIYFMMLPYIFIIFIPGLTMGVWSKEYNMGTLELVFTLPLKQMDILIGKFLAALTVVVSSLAFTIIIPIFTDINLGAVDKGQLVAQYFGAIIIACSYISITFFFSSLTKELIDSFLLSSSFLFILTILGYISGNISFPENIDWVKKLFAEISLSTHFLNFSKGVIDISDVIFYLGLSALFIYLNMRALESKRWS